MKLQPKDFGIIAIIIAAGAALTWFTVKKFGGEGTTAPPTVAGKANFDIPQGEGGGVPKVPEESAN